MAHCPRSPKWPPTKARDWILRLKPWASAVLFLPASRARKQKPCNRPETHVSGLLFKNMKQIGLIALLVSLAGAFGADLKVADKPVPKEVDPSIQKLLQPKS